MRWLSAAVLVFSVTSAACAALDLDTAGQLEARHLEVGGLEAGRLAADQLKARDPEPAKKNKKKTKKPKKPKTPKGKCLAAEQTCSDDDDCCSKSCNADTGTCDKEE
ncbi:hypothetical protein CSUB01_03627 [Colletotrichum sublineola]|uniref:Uncharacterized protein n=1 Tax=Colletotrichum sublineola TaxID=1173701 RepID=A0A066XEG5_COLSU|nr:hypothetical protein CSUB01_03627 [Colletotrichum sublineola]